MSEIIRLFNITIHSKNFWKAVVTFIIAYLVYLFLPVPESFEFAEASRRTAFVFVIAGMFWALEIIPLYATSLVSVVLLILLLTRPGNPLLEIEGGYKAFLLPFASPVIMLFFGGFILAAALHKYNIDSKIAKRLLRVFGQNPLAIMMGFMLTTAFLSMWMSNTATTAMMLIMIMPLLGQLKKGDPFKKALVLAIPFGANIGGVGTPVGTPPNAIAIGILTENGIKIDFLTWMMMAVPLTIIMLIIVCAILYFMFKPQSKTINLELPPVKPMGWRARGVVIISLFTIALWLTAGIHKIPEALVALIGAGLFFALGLLDKEDIKHIDWDVLVLMWGGLALGQAMEASKLTEWIVSFPIFNNGEMLLGIFCILAMILSTFMSNTAAANLLIPIAISIPGENPIYLALAVALSCSFAMALPISTPPNAMAFSTNVIESKDMLKAGTISSLIAVVFVILGAKFIIKFVFGLG
jgi:sodium-dependent dicarboxylate transporter 2/3/5